MELINILETIKLKDQERDWKTKLRTYLWVSEIAQTSSWYCIVLGLDITGDYITFLLIYQIAGLLLRIDT